MQGSFLVFSILTCSQNSTMSYFLGGQNETKELTGSKIIGFWMHYIYRLAAVRIPFCLFWHFEVTARKGVSRSTDGELVTTLTKTKMDTRCRIPASSRNCKTHDKYICLLYRDIKFVYIYIYMYYFFSMSISQVRYIYTHCIHMFVSSNPSKRSAISSSPRNLNSLVLPVFRPWRRPPTWRDLEGWPCVFFLMALLRFKGRYPDV